MIVADSGPLRYLILIGAIDVVPRLFGQAVIPEIVGVELAQPSTPLKVRQWLATAPTWLKTRPNPPAFEEFPVQLGAGERAAIALAQAMPNALLLIDDRAGIAAARLRGLRATGTLGVLVRAAELGMLEFPTAFERLKATNF